MKNLGIIEKYHDGELNEIERQDFINKQSSDEKFINEFRLFTEVNNFLFYNKKRDKFIQTLKNSQDKQFNKTIYIKSIYKYVASITVIILLSLTFLFVNKSKPDNIDLYKHYYTQYKLDIVSRSSVNGSSFIEDVYKLYEQRNFNSVILKIEENKKTTEIVEPIILIKALSYAELKDFKMAKQILIEATKEKRNAFYDDFAWYLSLIYLKDNNILESKELLFDLINRKSIYSNKAKEILAIIN